MSYPGYSLRDSYPSAEIQSGYSTASGDRAIHFVISLSVPLNESGYTFASGHFPSSSNSFYILFIHSSFLQFSFNFYILLSDCFVSFTFGCWFVHMHSSLILVEFYSFLTVLLNFKLVTPYRYLLGLPYFSNIFWFIPSILVFSDLSVFLNKIFVGFLWVLSSLAISFVVAASLFILLSSSSILVLYFCLHFFMDAFLSPTSFAPA